MSSGASEPTSRALAGAVRGIILAAVLFVLVALATGPLELLWNLDLKPGYFRDFRIYLEQARLFLGDGGLAAHWTYPPLLALLIAPLAPLSTAHAEIGWWVVQLAVLAAYASLLQRVLAGHGRRSWPLALALLITSLPVVHGLKWGQVSSAIAVAGAYALTRPERHGAAALGAAAACKLYPLLFLLGPLARRQYRFALA